MVTRRNRFAGLMLACSVAVPALNGCGADGSSSQTGATTAATGVTTGTSTDTSTGISTGVSTGTSTGTSTGAVTRAADGPALTGCAAFHSGRYFIVNPHQQTDVRTALVDAATMSMTQSSVAVSLLAPNDTCDYSYDNGTARVTVSSAGLAMIRHAAAGARVDLAIPEQVFAPADLAGSWNLLAYSELSSGAGPKLHLGKLTIAADGSVSSIDCGNDVGVCGASVAVGRIELNPAGGFLLGNGASSSKPLFAMKGTDGSMMLVITDATGVAFAVSDRALQMPVGGDLVRAWELSINGNGDASELLAGDYLVSAVTVAQHTFERYRLVDGLADVVTLNAPRDGLAHRSAGSATLLSGVATAYPELILMAMDGIGLTVYGSVTGTAADALLGLVMRKPAP